MATGRQPKKKLPIPARCCIILFTVHCRPWPSLWHGGGIVWLLGNVEQEREGLRKLPWDRLDVKRQQRQQQQQES